MALLFTLERYFVESFISNKALYTLPNWKRVGLTDPIWLSRLVVDIDFNVKSLLFSSHTLRTSVDAKKTKYVQ